MKIVKHRKATKAKFSIGTIFANNVAVFLLDHIHTFKTCLPQRLLTKYAEFGLPWWLRGKESAVSAGDLGSIHPWVRKIPWRRKWQHSSILAWEIPWTEKLGLQSMGSQRVGHNSGTKQQHAEFIRPSLIQSKVRNEYFTQRIPHFTTS